ncbi:multicopper oxidase domain-containing protein [Geoalkalibacter sp.]|uniref:multicopper oxidase domain-containing protein n=1 Tax=Geoalkalibacter sp. TaxID=3041440 RepID=UPI00272E41A4|nr:multicopper oxidase domain-containing protein [Geoalkalibacter sp.]
MAEIIPRDLGTPINQVDPFVDPDFAEFMIPPDTTAIFLDLEDPAANATNSRAHRLFRPSLVAGLTLGPPPADPDNPQGIQVGFLPTPDAYTGPDPVVLYDRRGLHDLQLNVPGLGQVEVWSFRANETNEAIWPATPIRVREGRVVKTLMNNRRGPHTIHHHGIEPTAANDGVGHLTFDVGGGVLYNYQWKAKEAGTYFYHCHVNTVLHFEMGMYGLLIIDPDVDGAPFTSGGPGMTYQGNTLVDYHKEAFWVVDDIDRRWHANAVHGHSQDAGIRAGEFMRINDARNPRLHDFNPEVFVVSGVPAQWSAGRTLPNALVALDPGGQGSVVTPRVQRGQKLLVRALNASYTTTRWRFDSRLNGTVIAADARTLGREPFGRYSRPFSLASINHRFQLTTAQRWDILIDTTGLQAGNYDTEIGFYHWITDNHIQTIRTRIIVE